MWIAESFAMNGDLPRSREYTPLVDDAGAVVPVARPGYGTPDPGIPPEPPVEPTSPAVALAKLRAMGVVAGRLGWPMFETIAGRDLTGTAGEPTRTEPLDLVAGRRFLPDDRHPLFPFLPIVERNAAQPVIRDVPIPAVVPIIKTADIAMLPTPEFLPGRELSPSLVRAEQPLGSTTRNEDAGKLSPAIMLTAVAALVGAAIWYSRA